MCNTIIMNPFLYRCVEGSHPKFMMSTWENDVLHKSVIVWVWDVPVEGWNKEKVFIRHAFGISFVYFDNPVYEKRLCIKHTGIINCAGAFIRPKSLAFHSLAFHIFLTHRAKTHFLFEQKTLKTIISGFILFKVIYTYHTG